MILIGLVSCFLRAELDSFLGAPALSSPLCAGGASRPEAGGPGETPAVLTLRGVPRPPARPGPRGGPPSREG